MDDTICCHHNQLKITPTLLLWSSNTSADMPRNTTCNMPPFLWAKGFVTELRSNCAFGLLILHDFNGTNAPERLLWGTPVRSVTLKLSASCPRHTQHFPTINVSIAHCWSSCYFDEGEKTTKAFWNELSRWWIILRVSGMLLMTWAGVKRQKQSKKNRNVSYWEDWFSQRPWCSSIATRHLGVMLTNK